MLLRFNSIKVRLILNQKDGSTAGIAFQFHKGTINTRAI